jgi:hypothetical protein
MPDYIQTALYFNYKPTKHAKHQAHWHNLPQYGVKTQLTDPINATEPLDKKGNLQLQQITEKLQYYYWAFNPTMNITLSMLASQQTHGAQQTKKVSDKFLDYYTPWCQAPLPILWHDIKGPLGWILQLGAQGLQPGRVTLLHGNQGFQWQHPGVILATTSIMQPVLTSASEVETGALYKNTKSSYTVHYYPTRNGTSTASHPYPDQNFYHLQHCQQQHKTAMFMCHWHAFQLDLRLH